MFLFPYISSALKTNTWNVFPDYIYPNVCEASYFSWFFQTGFLCVIAFAVLDPHCGPGWLTSNSHRSTCLCLPSMRAPPSCLCEAFFCEWMYMDSIDWALWLDVFSFQCQRVHSTWISVSLPPLVSNSSYLPWFLLNTSPWGIPPWKDVLVPDSCMFPPLILS